MQAEQREQILSLVDRLRAVPWKDREAVKDAIQTAALSAEDRAGVVALLEEARKSLSLELRWEVDEVLEALTPPPAPPVEEEPPAEQVDEDPPDDKLSYSDLIPVYEDPRGLALHRTKSGKRWFATQMDPQTGQPRTFEITTEEAAQLKQHLAGSPYWVVGG
ncbi:MAG: hypothetical protein JXX28_06820 [Deltaproteobacteria bacterium]|nr:hypothetical protein [Deltaproteobacteria bacterium]